VDAIANCTDRHFPKERSSWSRRRIAEKLADFHRRDSPWISSRQIAQQIDVPDRTLHHWVSRQRTLLQNSSWPRDTTQFFESPQGLDLLRRLMTAAHLVFVQANDCGLRNLGWFLQLSGLDQFIAPSYGAQQKVAEEMESLLIRFGREEDQRLAAQMPPREITLCEDETFHPQICLVAIEPVSDFILLEQYQPQRADDKVPLAESAGELKRLMDQGKTRAVGVSNLNLAQLEEFSAECPLAAFQPPYNMLQRTIEADTLPWCREHGVSVLVYWPLMKGLLAGKLSRDHVFAATDGRPKYPMFQGEEWRKNQDFVDRLREIAADAGRTVAQLVINWTINRPGISSALCGAKRPEQIQETAAGADWQLTGEQLSKIETALANRGEPVTKTPV